MPYPKTGLSGTYAGDASLDEYIGKTIRLIILLGSAAEEGQSWTMATRVIVGKLIHVDTIYDPTEHATIVLLFEGAMQLDLSAASMITVHRLPRDVY